MTAFYDNLAVTASKLLHSYGQEIKFTRNTGNVYNAATGTTIFTTTTFKGYGVVLAYQSAEIDGQNILSSDLKLLLEQSKKIPAVNDVALVGTSSYLVFAVNQTNPAGTNVVTNCQLRIGDSVSDIR